MVEPPRIPPAARPAVSPGADVDLGRDARGLLALLDALEAGAAGPGRAAVLQALGRRPGAEAREALEERLTAPEPAPAWRQLQAWGVLGVLVPEVEALVALGHTGEGRHKDVWEHTLEVLTRCPARPRLRWAALLHDIGKAATRRVSPGGSVSFHGHAELGATLVEGPITMRLAFPTHQAAALACLVRQHQRAASYDGSWSDAAVRRLGRELVAPLVGLPEALAEALPRDLLDLARADVTSRLPGRREAALARVEALAVRLRALQATAGLPRALPPGLGHRIAARFGLRPGPALGRIRRRLEAAVSAGVLPPGQDAEVYLRHLEEEGLGEASEDGQAR